ncbi:hypothetical protein DERP_006192 [Dermatophagoides pteronyssinus]|uniref:Uncharacterized protein n=1 Tax=Dermatophagoides pteronyssinus TaxID=6956 RepID=A0ABQ8IXR9_DERPT|nr:hypothetical protein DERP_006192 [Dermatophagoides pteronyssinus]
MDDDNSIISVSKSTFADFNPSILERDSFDFEFNSLFCFIINDSSKYSKLSANICIRFSGESSIKSATPRVLNTPYLTTCFCAKRSFRFSIGLKIFGNITITNNHQNATKILPEIANDSFGSCNDPNVSYTV